MGVLLAHSLEERTTRTTPTGYADLRTYRHAGVQSPAEYRILTSPHK